MHGSSLNCFPDPMEDANDQDSIKEVSCLPECFQRLFDFRYFNTVQSETFNVSFYSDCNLVVSAPTGSGKTVLFELAILKMLMSSVKPDGTFSHSPGQKKAVYVAPMKALVQEKHRVWTEKFSQHLNLKCKELTGDSEFSVTKDMHEVDIILTTPEKFDSITRKGKDFSGIGFFADISLLLIDEVHLLNDPRGASLEAIVSRLKMLSRFPEMRSCPISEIRFVAVSATIPNIEDIAEWLRAPREGLRKFGEEVRPVKLKTFVQGYSNAKNDFLFERRLQIFLFEVISQYSEGKPTLVFCSTRKGAQESAVKLAEQVLQPNNRNPFIKCQEQLDRLHNAVMNTTNKPMQMCLKQGVAFHNGGLEFNERSLVEGLFLRGDIQVICTTNTLAHGVNLPAHLVVIKSTQYYNKEKGGYVEYERSMLLQMAGRAGRPQFDTSGTVVIMTRKETVHSYDNLLSGCEPVESELLGTIAEHLNAEIVLSTVSDTQFAIEWLKNSYLYVRIKKNPQHYRIPRNLTPVQLENKLREVCLKSVDELMKYGMVVVDGLGAALRPLEPGKIMARQYISFNTMKAIVRVSDSCFESLLWVIGEAQELSWIKLRRNEKKALNDINCSQNGKVKFPVLGPNGKLKKRIQEGKEKIVVLINDALSGDPSGLDFTLSQDVNGICLHGSRIARCMSQYFEHQKRFKEMSNALLLGKCLSQRLWEDCPFLLKQLSGIGMVTAKALVNAGVSTFSDIEKCDPRRIEVITGRRFPFGNQIKDTLDSLPPKVELTLDEKSEDGRRRIYVTLLRVGEPKKNGSKHFSHLVVGSEADNHILFHERIRLEQFASPYTTPILSNNDNVAGAVVAKLIHDDWVGIDLEKRLTPSFANNSKKKKLGKAAEPGPARKGIPAQKRESFFAEEPKEEKVKLEINSANEECFEIPNFTLVPDESGNVNQPPGKEHRFPPDNDGRTKPNSSGNSGHHLVKDMQTPSGNNIFCHIKKKGRLLPKVIGNLDTSFGFKNGIVGKENSVNGQELGAFPPARISQTVEAANSRDATQLIQPKFNSGKSIEAEENKSEISHALGKPPVEIEADETTGNYIRVPSFKPYKKQVGSGMSIAQANVKEQPAKTTDKLIASVLTPIRISGVGEQSNSRESARVGKLGTGWSSDKIVNSECPMSELTEHSRLTSLGNQSKMERSKQQQENEHRETENDSRISSVGEYGSKLQFATQQQAAMSTVAFLPNSSNYQQQATFISKPHIAVVKSQSAQAQCKVPSSESSTNDRLSARKGSYDKFNPSIMEATEVLSTDRFIVIRDSCHKHIPAILFSGHELA